MNNIAIKVSRWKGRYKKMSLSNDNKSSKKAFWVSPIQCTRKSFNTKHQETSFCIYRKASLTVEAAVVCPLTAGVLLSIFFFSGIVRAGSGRGSIGICWTGSCCGK